MHWTCILCDEYACMMFGFEFGCLHDLVIAMFKLLPCFRCMIGFSYARWMLGFVYVCGLALYCFMDRYDMLFWDDDAMLYVRCMLVCVWV